MGCAGRTDPGAMGPSSSPVSASSAPGLTARRLARTRPPMKLREATTAAQPISAEEAAALVTSGMWLDYGTGVGQPDVFDRGPRRPSTSSRTSRSGTA